MGSIHGRYDRFASAFINQNNELALSSAGGLGLTSPTKMLQRKTESIIPKNMTKELFAEFLMTERGYSSMAVAMKHVPHFGFTQRNVCKRIQKTLQNDQSHLVDLSTAQVGLGKRNTVENSQKKPPSHTHGGPFSKLRRLFKFAGPTKSSLISELKSERRTSAVQKYDLAGLAMIGAREMEKAGVSASTGRLDHDRIIQREFTNSLKHMTEFLGRQQPDVREKILKALASKDCTAIMGFLLNAARMNLDSTETSKIFNSLATALKSRNRQLAISFIVQRQEMQLPISNTFLDDLCLKPTSSRSYINFNAEELIQSNERMKVNSSFGSEHELKEKIITFLDGPEVGGKNFFTDANFEEKLEAVAEKLVGLTLFIDMSRNFQYWELAFGERKISLDGCPREVGGAVKFFLRKLKDSGLTPEASLNALKSICRYGWVQGESARPLVSHSEVLMESGEDNCNINVFVLPNIIAGGKTKFEFSNTGNIRVTSQFTIDSTLMTCKDNIRRLENDTDKPNVDLATSYAIGFTSIECTPEGGHTILDSMLALRI
ncbi:MAG: hypothetical protein LBD72_02290 [Puniceicoccales bacterium]|jgi:hypothetical protein|nr:hypothetical protein [Puniceicoccales bacterium]